MVAQLLQGLLLSSSTHDLVPRRLALSHSPKMQPLFPSTAFTSDRTLTVCNVRGRHVLCASLVLRQSHTRSHPIYPGLKDVKRRTGQLTSRNARYSKPNASPWQRILASSPRRCMCTPGSSTSTRRLKTAPSRRCACPRRRIRSGPKSSL
ncbi:hypothetical protein C8R45DRAFT_571954 [Mycena sanguinolenta]|nr:hypothetical protein C8R45DRAFT_571954 [Mycena sanguinolenta]